jgi:hypothetical protein
MFTALTTAALLAASALAPSLVAQAEASPAQARFDAARVSFGAGDYERAASEFEAVAADPAASSELQASARVLGEEARRMAKKPAVAPAPAPATVDYAHDKSGRGELTYFLTFYGIWVVDGTAATLDVTGGKEYLALTILGAGAGLGGGLLASKYLPMPAGRAATVDAATVWASVNAMSIGLINDWEGDTVRGATIAAGLAAFGTGLALTRRSAPTEGAVTLVDSAGGWGFGFTALGMLTFANKDLTGKQVGWSLLAGADAGLAIGALLANRYPMSRGRVLVIDAAGFLGGLVGVAVPVFSNSENRRVWFGAPMAGMAVGLAAGTWLTRSWDAPASTAANDGPSFTPTVFPTANGGFVAGVGGRF